MFLISFLLSFPSFLFNQKSDTLWPYLSHLFHSPLNNLLFLLYLFSPEFNSRTFSSGSVFYFVLFPFNFFFSNQRISFLRSLNSIFNMLILHDTLTGFYSSGKMSKKCDFRSSSYFSYFDLIFFNLRFKLNISLNQISGY